VLTSRLPRKQWGRVVSGADRGAGACGPRMFSAKDERTLWRAPLLQRCTLRTSALALGGHGVVAIVVYSPYGGCTPSTAFAAESGSRDT